MTEQQTETWAYLQPLPADMARDTPVLESQIEHLRRQMQSHAARDGYAVAVDAEVTVTQMPRHTDYQWDEEDQQYVDQGWPTESLDDPDTNQVLVRLEVPAVKV